MKRSVSSPENGVASAGTQAARPSTETRGTGAVPQRYALGPTGRDAATPRQIPWGYGFDRITAMPIDPARMFVYWELTDDAIAKAREGLGAGGGEAWLNLRVYDITGRIFDGTNAHSYFDHTVERSDRQWFFHIGKPMSTACVEIGLKSREGYFVKIARSGRVEFPRTEPALWSEPQWLTVFSGKVGASHTGGPGGHRARGSAPGPGGPGGPGEGGPPGSEGWEHSAIHRIVGHMLTGRWEWHQILRGGAFGEHAIEWVGPLTRTTWEAGPFTYPIELPVYVEERAGGEAMVHTEDGVVHVLFGPWQVIIRGIDARLEKRVLATWEMFYSWVVPGGTEELVGGTATVVAPGSSELLLRGASERRWMGASEYRLGGASETFRVGASEIRFLGATETLFRGASERRLMGASEYFYRGASEYAYRGASEQMFQGASERAFPGASEGFAGASETRLQAGQEGTYPVSDAPKTPPDR
jgi:hypothetical protein